MLPRCTSCGSLERHRALRAFFALIGTERFKNAKAVQFSPDPSAEPQWFKSFTLASYPQFDLQKLVLEPESFDVAICCHVLEHVRDDLAALRELRRITSRDGLVIVMVPDPARTPHTSEWGYADPKRDSHYRLYGRDFASRITKTMPEAFLNVFQMADPVTGTPDVIYAITRHQEPARLLAHYRTKNRAINVSRQR